MATGDPMTQEFGDTASFDAWALTRVAAFLRYGYLVTGDCHDAEDAVQDALAAAYAKWPTVSASRDVDAYVRRMIANAHISRWRRTRRRETPTPEPRRSGTPDSDADGWSALEPFDQDMWAACTSLPRRQRAALVLRFYEDLSFAEIATILDCAEPTARSLVHRGLAVLRTNLTTTDEDSTP
jgi:RNA polymerase sigma-70 factor (sigma-E family)